MSKIKDNPDDYCESEIVTPRNNSIIINGSAADFQPIVNDRPSRNNQ